MYSLDQFCKFLFHSFTSTFQFGNKDRLLSTCGRLDEPFNITMKFACLIAVAAASKYDQMNEDELLVSLESTLSSAQRSEARGDGDAAVAKTAAIKNIQKALTAIKNIQKA